MRHVARSAGTLLAAALALGGCGSGAIELADASITEVARATDAIPRPEPGQWRTDAQLTAFDPGGEDTPMAAAMRAQIGAIDTTEACLGAEEADRPLFGDLSPTEGADCVFPRFAYRDGRLDATMVCRNAGSTLTVTQRGAYAAQAVDLTSIVRRTDAQGRASGGQTTRVVARRTGECR